MNIEAKPYKLINTIQNYDWGTRNEKAFIPELLGIETETDKPYAELWIGAHKKAPSKVIVEDKGISIIDLLKDSSNQILGKEASVKFDGKLPFLFKILSAGEALSIQAHPGKREAEVLNNIDPENYPDKNHKPEIAIAIDDLTALAGFRSHKEISKVLDEYSELTDLIGAEPVKRFIEADENNYNKELRDLYSSLMINSEKDARRLKKTVKATMKRINKNKQLNEEQELIVGLNNKYGYDVGLYSILLLNILHLKSGEAIYLDTGIPHAYLKGNIVECMANSDNVVRAGLTAKFKDISTLIHILNYDSKTIEVLGSADRKELIEYNTPSTEFKISKYSLEEGKSLKFENNKTSNILLILDGSICFNDDKTEFVKGEVLLLPAVMESFSIKSVKNTQMFWVKIPE
ncbi:MAG: mannose-6-phosphate isomerase, class I [Melioribacteraceae bacterium]|nr:mannose-6-phosphate isomerase, class I [Melioribacteraceae bacterium]